MFSPQARGTCNPPTLHNAANARGERLRRTPGTFSPGILVTFYMTRSRALPRLKKIRPTASLLGYRTVLSIASQARPLPQPA